ncbi:MAG TPA: hypothetical protein VIP11_14085 [Gemmatimonadaceae bacterium]
MSNREPTTVSLTRDIPPPQRDRNVALYNSIRNNSENLSFNTYSAFLTAVFTSDEEIARMKTTDRIFEQLVRYCSQEATASFDCLGGTHAYEALRRATEMFVMTLAAPLETCGCYRSSRTDGAGENGDMLKAAKYEAEQIVAEEKDSIVDDVSDINRRYTPHTVHNLAKLIEQLVKVDPTKERDLMYGDPTIDRLKLLPLMRRLRQNLRGVPMSGTEGDDDFSGVLRSRLQCPPFIELIWNYWMEQGMLVQGINAISLRFQNQRRGALDPLRRMDLTALRPMSNVFWGYIQTERDRLSLVRRAYEYDHHYGLRLAGRGVPTLYPADSRPRFLEAFHHLLAEATRFYRLSMDTTVNPDTFPVLNALKELHLILSEGAANQFGDLPATARQEMLIQQWLIGRAEMRDFIGGRPSVVYPESWMGHMDTLRQLFGWNDGSIRHYRDLAVFGERLLLSVRWGDWTSVTDNLFATSWLTFWREEIQNYVHSYQAVTGLDLNIDQVRTVQAPSFAAQPTELILRRRTAPARAIPAAAVAKETTEIATRDPILR